MGVMRGLEWYCQPSPAMARVARLILPRRLRVAGAKRGSSSPLPLQAMIGRHTRLLALDCGPFSGERRG